MLNRYGKIFGSGTQNVSNQIVAILGLSIQGLVGHIIILLIYRLLVLSVYMLEVLAETFC